MPSERSRRPLSTIQTQWVLLDRKDKLAGGLLMANMLQTLIPEYDLRRNIYVQCSTLASTKTIESLEQVQNNFLIRPQKRERTINPYLLSAELLRCCSIYLRLLRPPKA